MAEKGAVRQRRQYKSKEDPPQDNAPITEGPDKYPNRFSDGGHSRNSYRVCLILTLLAFVLRFHNIDHPSQVVFDEVHFGKFASYYLRRTFFFDVHPPFGKLMFALVGWLLGFDGRFLFESIGDDYIAANVPYVGLRCLSVVFGTMLVPLAYLTMREMGYPVLSAAFAATLLVLDNSLIVHSRLILLDAQLVFYMLFAFYSWVRFYKLREREFSREWWTWLFLTGTSLALTLSIKMVGLFLFLSTGSAVLFDLWRLLDFRRGHTLAHFFKHFFARFGALVVWPIVLYLLLFAVHFSVLSESGPGDRFMSPLFQATLANNLITAKSLEIRYGESVTLQHKDTKAFLHSHLHKYPLRYPDNRVSSQGQQVTGYAHRDDNNYWKIRRAIPFGDTESEYVRCGDIIQLEHVVTGTLLLTHDVASPSMPTNTEITTISPEKTDRYNDTLFKVEIEEGEPGKTLWRTHSSLTELIHVPMNVALWTPEKSLPDWGFGQLEINGSKKLHEKSTLWVPAEIKGRNVTTLEEVAAKPRTIGFWRKFAELQVLMLHHNNKLTKPHPYQSLPLSWPFLHRGISYWSQDAHRQQIYMMGNPFSWLLAIMGVHVMIGVFLADVLARRRNLELMGAEAHKHLVRTGGFFLLCWAFHYVPFFLMGRALFLHHYLPALVLSYMLLGVLFDFAVVRRSTRAKGLVGGELSAASAPQTMEVPRVAYKVYALTIGLSFAMFLYFAPITYGTPGLSADQVLARKWLSSWDFQFAK